MIVEEEMVKNTVIVLLGLFIFLGWVSFSFADARSYVWTYEYQTMPQGASEMEYYETVKVPDTNDPAIKTLEHWLEYEYGITNKLDGAVYFMWKTKDKRFEADTKYDMTKLRFRYRIGEKGQLPVDTLLYAEYKRSARHHDPHKIELKVILAKDLGDFNLSYNQILNQDLESDGITESEYALGLSYKLNNNISLGIESKGSYLSDKYYFGPTVSVRPGKFWVTAGFVSALHKRADDLQARVIVGVPF